MPNNEYDELLAPEAPAQPKTEDVYGPLFTEVKEEQKTAVQRSMFVASQGDPERKAKAMKIAERVKVDPGFVERNLEAFEQKDQQKSAITDYDALIQDTPGLAKFLSDPNNATLAKDDIDSLSKIDKAKRLYRQSIGPDLERAGSTGINNLASSTFHLAAAYGLMSPEEAAEQVAGFNKRANELQAMMPDYAKEFSATMEKEGGDVNRAFQRLIGSSEEFKKGNIKKALIDLNLGAIQTPWEALEMVAAAARRPKGLAYSGVESLAFSAPSLVTGAAGMAAGTAALPGPGTIAGLGIGTFVGSAGTEIGAQFNESLKERGVDVTDPEAILAAYRDPKLMAEVRGEAERKGITTASVEAIVSMVGGRFAAKVKGGKIAQGAAGLGVESAGEVAGEFSGQVARERGDLTKVDLGSSILEGIASFGQSTVQAGLSNAASKARSSLSKDPIEATEELTEKVRDALETEKDFKTLVELGQAVTASKMATRMPEKLAELIDQANEGGEAKSVYFQSQGWDDYWKSKGLSPVQMADQILKDGGKAYAEAKETGGNLEIPLSKYVSGIATTEHHEALLNQARTKADGMTLAEAQEVLTELPNVMSELAQEVSAPVEVKPDTSESIRANVFEQLIATGMNEAEARTNADLVQSTFRTMAQRTGKDAAELFNRYNLRISNEQQADAMAAQGEVFEQSWKLPKQSPSGKDFPQQIPVSAADPKILGVEPSLLASHEDTKLARAALKAMEKTVLRGKHTNAQTGWEIDVARNGISHSIKTAGSNTAALVAITKLNELIPNAIHIETQDNRDVSSRAEIAQYHGFVAPLSIGGKSYLVRLRVAENVNGQKFYDQLTVESKRPAGVIRSPETGASETTGFSGSAISIADLEKEISQVKQEHTYFQGEQATKMAPAFYSKMIQTVEQKMGGSATPDQINGMLREIKPEERKWMGLDEFLKDKQKISKEELLAHLRGNMVEIQEVVKSDAPPISVLPETVRVEANQARTVFNVFDDGRLIGRGGTEAEARQDALSTLSGDQVMPTAPKFGQYVLPGGENYREVLFTLPGNEFQSSHFDEKGVIAHVRLNDRYAPRETAGAVEPKLDKVRADRLSAYAETLSNLVESKAFKAKGLGGFKVKDREAMLSSMLGAIGDAEVRRAIIQFVPVNVMNDIVGSQLTPEQFFGDNAMLTDSLTVNPNAAVKLGRASEGSLVSAVAGLAAKEAAASSDTVRLPVDGDLAPEADGVGGRHGQERILFVEEIQSDLHQEGRKKGYKGELPSGWKVEPNTEGEAKFKVRDENGEMQGYGDTEAEATEMAVKNRKAVPDAPFRKTWHEFVLKRLIREAAEKGYDRIAWTTGEQQEDRYWGNESVAPAVERWKEVTKPEGVRELGENVLGAEMAAAMPLEVMDGGMLTALQNNKVRKAVIKLLPVDVVNVLTAAKTTPNKLFSKPDVVFESLPVEGRNAVAIGILDAIRIASTAVRTELKGLKAGGSDIQLLPTLKASDLSAREVAGLLDPERLFHLGSGGLKESSAAARSVTESTPSKKAGVFGGKLGSTELAELLNAHAELIHGKEGLLQQAFQPPPGEGMKGFYDKILVDFANKFGKKYGAKVGETTLGEETAKAVVWDTENDEAMIGFDSKKEAQDYIDNSGDPTLEVRTSQRIDGGTDQVKVHSLDITPALKEAALTEGFTLFQGGDKPRGQIGIGKSGINIALLKDADPSTFLHEMGHFYLEVLGDITQNEDVPQQIKDDYQTILDWMGVKDRSEIKTEHHEKFARGFETYLMEGKAPSTALRKVFAHFKVWLTAIYKQVLALDANLTPEVRGVFDRIIATDEEIKSLNKKFEPMAPSIKDLGLNEKKAERYLDAREEAHMAISEELNAELQQDFNRAKEQWYRDRKAAIREEVAAEVTALPEYRALDILKNGLVNPDAPANMAREEIKLSREFVKDAWGKDVYNSFPKGVFGKKGEGLHPDMAAEMLGFESGDALVKALSGLPSPDSLIDRITEQRMQEEHPDMLNDGRLPEVAMKAFHSEARAKLLRMELEYLVENHLPVVKDLARQAIRRVPSEKAVREQAERLIGSKDVKDVKPHVFERAERKAAKEAADAFAKGDFDACFQAKRKELLNHELYKAALRANEKTESFLEWAKRVTKADEKLAKSRDMDMVYAARALLSQYGIGRSQKGLPEYLEKIKRYDPDTYVTIAALVASANERVAPYEQLTMAEFESVQDAVRAIWGLAKSTREMEVDGKNVDRDEIKAELSNRLAELTQAGARPGENQALSDGEKRTMGLRSIRSLVRRVESWAYAMDKGNINGPFTKYIVRPVLQATTAYRLRQVETLEKLRAIVQELKIDNPNQKIAADEIGYTFTKPELIMALLHTGNDSNKEKLLLGRKWGSKTEDGALISTKFDAFLKRAFESGIITKNDMDVVQKIWDLNEELKPGAQKAHKKMFGYFFNEITAKEVATPFGNYRGGYMPAVADQYLSVDANIRSGGEIEETPAQMFPTTGKGFTQSRVEGYHTPLSLDFGKIQSHIDKVLRFTHIEPVVKDTARLLNDRGLRAEMNAYTHDLTNDLLIPWLKRAATQKSATQGWSKALDKYASAFRRVSSIQFMVLNVTNAIQNFTGISPTMTRVGPIKMAGAFKRYLTDAKNQDQMIQEASPYMRSRIGKNLHDINKDIEDFSMNPTKFEKFKDEAIHHGYILERATNGIVEKVVWSAAHDQALEEGKSAEDAVNFADATVRQTLTGMNPEDISRFETGTPFVKLFTMFSGWFNAQANLYATELAIAKEDGYTSKAGAARALRAHSLVVAVPAILSAIIMRAMSGDGLDEDDDGEYFDDVADLFFMSQIRYMTAMAPGGTVINSVVNRFNNKPFDDKVSLSPAFSNFDKAMNAPWSVAKAVNGKGSSSKATKEVLAGLGLATGLPLSPLGKPIGYALDVKEKKAKPTGPVDAVRGAVTGKPGKP